MSSNNSKMRRRHIHALTRRAEYLRTILAEDTGPRPGRDFDIAELSALKAAIEIVRKHYTELAQRSS